MQKYFLILTIALMAIFIIGYGTLYGLTQENQQDKIFKPDMAEIPCGVFEMGNLTGQGENIADELPKHQVKLNTFYMGKYEVTNLEFVEFLNEKRNNTTQEELDLWISIEPNSQCGIEGTKKDGYSVRKIGETEYSKRPVVYVSWYGAVEYCNWLSQKHDLKHCYDDSYNFDITKNGYRLPTEAEWEYACRAGEDNDFFWNQSYIDRNMSPGPIDEYCCYRSSNNNDNHHVINKLTPNKYGLYHMSGNVYEWCNDWYNPNYYQNCKSNIVVNPTGPVLGDKRVTRGGGWNNSADDCRSSSRFCRLPSFHNYGFGFRIVKNGKDWKPIGEQGFSKGATYYTSLCVYNETPYVAYRDSSQGNKAFVMKFNGNSWETVGNTPLSPGAVGDLSLFVCEGEPYVAYRDETNANKLSVSKFDNNSWQTVGDPNRPGISEEGANCLSIYVTAPNYIFVAYRDEADGDGVTVKKYYDHVGKWETVGKDGFPDVPATSLSLVLYKGQLCVGYRDKNDPYGRASVMTHDGSTSSWSYLGKPKFTTNGADFESLCVDADNDILYIAFADEASAGRATVMSYNEGTKSWEFVGKPAFTPEEARYIKLDVCDGVPYIAYQDKGNGCCAGVMKYNSKENIWEPVGISSLRETLVGHIDIDVYNGNPYIAFMDVYKDLKATCLSFTD